MVMTFVYRLLLSHVLYLAYYCSGRLLLRSLGTNGFCDVTESPCDVTDISLAVNDRAHGICYSHRCCRSL